MELQGGGGKNQYMCIRIFALSNFKETFFGATALSGPGFSHSRGFLDHTQRLITVGRTGDQLVAKTST